MYIVWKWGTLGNKEDGIRSDNVLRTGTYIFMYNIHT